MPSVHPEYKSPRELTTHIAAPADPSSGHVRIFVSDDKGPGGAHHLYNVVIVTDDGYANSATGIKFQMGGIKDAGYNGLTNEALLAIVIDRLECFQAGAFPNAENKVALTRLQSAMTWLHLRTQDRIARGVEGEQRA